MTPRRAALDILLRLDAAPKRLESLLFETLGRMERSQPRDRALASRLVYTVLRNRLYLDFLLNRFVSRPLAKLDPAVLQILRLGAAELLFMNTPDHAAVHAAVELAKSGPARRAQGMVNGALRSLARSRKKLPSPGGDPARRLSVLYSHPRWLVEELLDRLPPDEVEAWLAANQEEPPLTLRANTLKTDRDRLAAVLAPAAEKVSPHPLCPDSLTLQGFSGPPSRAPGFQEGLFQVQDAGASAATLLLGAGPGQKVLDLCAGAGGKTGHLAALMKNTGQLTAVEPSPGRRRGLEANLARLGVTNARVLQADGTRPEAGWGKFQRILVDAPCTGLGVAGRRPDLRWRKTPADAEGLAALQADLVRAAAGLLAPGGVMVYCTCTVTRRENEDVVAGLLREDPGLSLEPVGLEADGDGFFRTLPHRDQCDAFFAAKLTRKA